MEKKMSNGQKSKSEKKIMTGAEIVMAALLEHGVDQIFGYPGGTVLPMYDILYTNTPIHHTLVSHEQGAVHAAEGYARSSGKIGVAMATSGPGATNTVTGIMDAFADSVPLLVITGQVHSALLGTRAFQECDIVNITKPCTKRSYLVKDVAELPRILHEAFYMAQNGRPGPVLVDIPKDVQCAKGVYRAKDEVKLSHESETIETSAATNYSKASVKQAISMMLEAERPVFYTGGGVINSGPEASKLLRELVELTDFPITSTLLGLGAYPASGKRWLGMLGMHGTYEANKTMHESDLIIALGARFDDRVTGHVKKFAPKAKIIHIDIDPKSINKIILVDLGMVVDCGTALEAMVKGWKQESAKKAPKNLRAWHKKIDTWKSKNSMAYRRCDVHIKPQHAIEKLDSLIKGRDAFIVTDVGQHQMWAAQYIGFEKPNHFMTSGGLGTMGYGLPAAIGVQTAHPNALVVCITGDGSLQMNSQEMMTAAQQRLPIKVIILNNNALGMVRQWQEMFYENRCDASTTKGQPDFVKLAEAYGWTGMICSSPQDMNHTFSTWLTTPGMCLLDCRVNPRENCLPIIPPGAAHNEMVLNLNEAEV